MTTVLIGDSNFRDLISAHKDEIETKVGQTITFNLASSVASVKTIFENMNVWPEIVFVACPTNEITLKSRNNSKSREGLIEGVINELFQHVNCIADKQEKTTFVIAQPFLRYEPAWIDGKMKFYVDFVKNTHNTTSPSNVHLGSSIEIDAEDLKQDKVHLNKDGLAKLSEVMTNDFITSISERERRLTGLDEVEEDEEHMDVTPPPTRALRNTPPTRTLRITPARKRRPADDISDEEGGRSKKKKSKDKIDSVLEKLDLLMEKVTTEKISNNQRFSLIEEKLEETIVAQVDLKEEVKNLKKNEDLFSARVREDLDSVENLNARDTIIVKKLETATIPTDKKELSNLVLKTGKELLTLMLGDDKVMKFITPLYFNNNKRKPNPNPAPNERKELPPFKIVFKHMSDAIEFKEKAIAASKDPTHRMYKTHLSHQQSVGTRVRLSLLWGIAEYLKKEKKDSWVSQSSPKPALMVKENGLVKNYSFIEAVTTYGDKIEQKVKDEATKLATRFFYGQVEKIFVILKD
jgi:hypothetical protein